MIDTLCARVHVLRMNSHVQIRNVPASLHKKLKAKAAGLGLSLSDYLRCELERIANRPTMTEWIDMVRQRESVTMPPHAIVEAVRDSREGRDEHMSRFAGQPNR